MDLPFIDACSTFRASEQTANTNAHCVKNICGSRILIFTIHFFTKYSTIFYYNRDWIKNLTKYGMKSKIWWITNSKRLWTHWETTNTNSQALHSRGLAKSLLLLLIYLREQHCAMGLNYLDSYIKIFVHTLGSVNDAVARDKLGTPPWWVSSKKTKLAVFPVLQKLGLGLEILLIWSLPFRKLPGWVLEI